jgi:hypothetical protein
VVKRLGVVLCSAVVWVLVLAAQALAQYPPSQAPGGPTAPAQPEGGVAFTGSSISLGVIILISLVVVGVLLLLAGRRRRAGAVQ